MNAVVHAVRSYLFLTGSWLYEQVRREGGLRSEVLTHRLENLDVFPMPRERIHLLQDPFPGTSGLSAAARRVDELLTRRRFTQRVQVIKEAKGRVIHAHFGPMGYRMLGPSQELGVPLVTSFYGADVSRVPAERRIWRKRYQELFRHGQLFLCEGPHMAAILEKLGCPEDKIQVLRLGVDVDKIRFRPRNRSENGKTRLLLVGSFREKKGIPYAIEALALAKREFPSLALSIIGGAKSSSEQRLMDRCKRFVREAGLERDVSFLGYVKHGEYLEELAKAHILLAPSVTATNGDSEGGSPVVVTEAAAAGMPVIATRHADLPEIVKDEETGMLIPERDPGALAKAMVRLAGAPESWENMGHSARALVEAEFNAEQQSHRRHQLYESLL